MSLLYDYETYKKDGITQNMTVEDIMFFRLKPSTDMIVTVERIRKSDKRNSNENLLAVATACAGFSWLLGTLLGAYLALLSSA